MGSKEQFVDCRIFYFSPIVLKWLHLHPILRKMQQLKNSKTNKFLAFAIFKFHSAKVSQYLLCGSQKTSVVFWVTRKTSTEAHSHNFYVWQGLLIPTHMDRIQTPLKFIFGHMASFCTGKVLPDFPMQ